MVNMSNTCETHPPAHGLRSRISAGIDWFIPAHVRGGDLDVLRRARLVVTFAITLMLLAILYLMIFAWMGSEFCAFALAVAISIALFDLYLMRRGTSYLLTGNLLAAAAFGAYTVIAYRLGGHGALSLPWYASVPLIAAIIAGRRSAIVWVVIATLFLVAFYALDYRGYVFPNDLAAHHYKLLHLLAVIGLILLMLTLVHLYESAQDQMLRQVRRSEERFRLASDAASDLIYEWDLSSDRLEWFGNFDAVLGYEPDEFPRTLEAWSARIHPQDRSRLAESIARHRVSAEPIHDEYRIQRKDGSWRHWIDRGTAIVDNAGRPLKWIGACIDITERKAAEATLRAAKEQADAHARRAEQAMEDMGRMNAVMMGREQRVLEMKQEVNDLLAQLGQARKYEHV